MYISIGLKGFNSRVIALSEVLTDIALINSDEWVMMKFMLKDCNLKEDKLDKSKD